MDFFENDIEQSGTLNEMRAQYKAMKEHVDRQEIINDQLLRKIFRSHIRSIHSVGWTSSACAVFVMLSCPFTFHYNSVFNLSWSFVIATEIIMAICISFNVFWHTRINTSGIASKNLLEFAEEIKKLKIRYKRWIYTGFLLILPWLGWLCYEVYERNENKEMAIGIIIGVIVGAFIGMVIGLLLDHKVINHCNDIIDELKGF